MGTGSPTPWTTTTTTTGPGIIIDALPLDPRDWRDTDGDGIGDFEDRDADGDGVNNDQDEFPRDAREWTDTDGDGLGDNLDTDDDNDGLPDATDPQPLEGVRGDQLVFSRWFTSDGRYEPHWPTFPAAFVHPRRPAMFVYPRSSRRCAVLSVHQPGRRRLSAHDRQNGTRKIVSFGAPAGAV